MHLCVRPHFGNHTPSFCPVLIGEPVLSLYRFRVGCRPHVSAVEQHVRLRYCCSCLWHIEPSTDRMFRESDVGQEIWKPRSRQLLAKLRGRAFRIWRAAAVKTLSQEPARFFPQTPGLVRPEPQGDVHLWWMKITIYWTSSMCHMLHKYIAYLE